jgi:Cu/Ag efflux protein CusF
VLYNRRRRLPSRLFHPGLSKVIKEKTAMKNRMLIALGAVGLLLTTGCANTNKAPEATPQATAQSTTPAPTMVTEEVTTATFTVRAVNLEKRLVTLKDEAGKVFTIHVGEEARNLPQLKAGDRVVAQYYEAMAVSLSKDLTGGVTGKKETISAERTPLGQKPGGAVRNNVDIVANVTAINKKTRKVTLKGPERAITVKAPEDVDLGKIKVGDQVRVNYVEEFAIAVEPAPVKPVK